MADPAVRFAVPKLVFESRKLTMPVGTAPPLEPATVAVNVTWLPKTGALGEAVIATEFAACPIPLWIDKRLQACLERIHPLGAHRLRGTNSQISENERGNNS